MQDHASDDALPASALRWRRNSRPDIDYLVTLSDSHARSGYDLHLRYVPDKLLIEPSSLGEYLAAMSSGDADHPETLALALLDDINNDIVPRWVQIVVQSVAGGPAPAETVILEDRQPNWDNPAILLRLPTG